MVLLVVRQNCSIQAKTWPLRQQKQLLNEAISLYLTIPIRIIDVVDITRSLTIKCQLPKVTQKLQQKVVTCDIILLTHNYPSVS